MNVIPDQAVNKKRLDRMRSQLWGLSFVLIIGLAIGLILVYLPDGISRSEESGGSFWNQDYYLSIFLVGLCVLFCFYAILKRKELHSLSQKLREDERELEESQTRLSEIHSLFKLTTALNVHLPLDSILEIIVNRVVNAMKAQQATVMLYDPNTGLLETKATYGVESEYARNAQCKFGESIAGTVLAQKKPVLLDNSTDQELSKFFNEARNITSALVIPLYYELAI